jgi:GrpB-like predicted nucleotidyltransferase (UPF0157 family)
MWALLSCTISAQQPSKGFLRKIALGVVPDLTQVQVNVKSLEHLGFSYKSSYGIEGREYFSKDARKVHFHIFQQGNASIKKHLGFVQIMKSRPDLIDQLNRLKLELESKYPFDKHCYQQEKTFFYDEVHKMLYETFAKQSLT